VFDAVEDDIAQIESRRTADASRSTEHV